MNYKEGRSDRVNENSMINPFRLFFSLGWNMKHNLFGILAGRDSNKCLGTLRHMAQNVQWQHPPKGPKLHRVWSKSPFSAHSAQFWGRIIAHQDAFGRNLLCYRMPSLCRYLGKKAFPFEYLGGVWGSGWAQSRDDQTIKQWKASKIGPWYFTLIWENNFSITCGIPPPRRISVWVGEVCITSCPV